MQAGDADVTLRTCSLRFGEMCATVAWQGELSGLIPKAGPGVRLRERLHMSDEVRVDDDLGDDDDDVVAHRALAWQDNETVEDDDLGVDDDDDEVVGHKAMAPQDNETVEDDDLGVEA